MAKPLTETADRQIGREQLAALVREKMRAKDAAARANEFANEKISSAVENVNLHRGAFNLIAALARKDEQKRKDFLSAFDLYRDMAEEAGLFGDQHIGDLMDDAANGAKDDEEASRAAEEAEQIANNVTRLTRGIQKLEPNDGDIAAPVH